MNLVSLGTRGRGFVSGSAGIREDSILLTVPPNLILDVSNIESDERFAHFIGPLRSAGLDDRGVLALWYLVQLNTPQTHWDWYLDLIPKRYDLLQSHPLLSDEIVPGTSVGIIAHKMVNHISRQLRSICYSMKQLDPSNPILAIDKITLDEQWRLCHTLVLSRSGLFDCLSEGVTWNDQPIVILPGIDLVNHSDEPNAKIIRCLDGSVQLVATRNIESGEEITISYWSSHENAKLSYEQVLFTFGFIGGLNRFSLPMISFDRADTNKKRAVQRLVYVDSRPDYQRSSDEIYTDDVESAVKYFSIQCMNEKDLSDLTKIIIEEGGVKSKSNAMIDEYRSLGKNRLRAEIVKWKATVASERISHPLLSEYQQRLLVTIESCLSKLS